MSEYDFAFQGFSLRQMKNELKHINVCVCTYKRPQFLKRVLYELSTQHTAGLFTYSIVVADNDHLQSAEAVVSEFAAKSLIPVRYCVEPQQSIALARNRAVQNCDGDLIAFIDDDEFPEQKWLQNLFKALHDFNVDGVLGPVKRYFDEKPPEWIVRGKFYERPTHPTGFVIGWRKSRTGNTLLRKELFDTDIQPFDPKFRTGEDQDFFRRMNERGRIFVWCNEAIVYEVVPPVRWKRKFILKRALLRGAMERNVPTSGIQSIVKSVLAVPIYTLVLPFAVVLGQHFFMAFLVRIFDHMGKLLALVGIHPIKEKYVTE